MFKKCFPIKIKHALVFCLPEQDFFVKLWRLKEKNFQISSS